MLLREFPLFLVAARLTHDVRRALVFRCITYQQLGAWNITGRCETDASYIFDGGELLMRRLVDAGFDAYECNAPSHRQNNANGRAALALYNYFHTIVRQAGSVPPA